MNYVTINAKTDPALKQQATKLADDLGISLSIVINTALRNFVAERRLVVSEDYVPNAFLQTSITHAENDLKNKNYSRTTSKKQLASLIDSL